MKILVTNDDGINSPGLQELARELGKVARVVVVAPDREQSAIGTAVTLRHPLRVQEVSPLAPGVATYAVAGTPGDSVILALGKLVEDGVDLIVSGINRGLNLGEDVHISGTVGAALQGYLRGFSAMAVSVPRENDEQMPHAARLAALLAKRISAESLPTNIFLNVNLPDLPPAAKINRLRITRLADRSHINTVEERKDGGETAYCLVRRQAANGAGAPPDQNTDIVVVESGGISVTPLYFRQTYKPPRAVMESLCSGLLDELNDRQGAEGL